MIKTIIKRDGTREDFDAAKLNKWVIWSAEHIRSRVNWSSIVTKAVRSFRDEARSQDLQRELINQLNRTKRWPESLMAGRLYASLARKEIYDDKIPTLRKLHHKLAGLGLMIKLPYSDADYHRIEKFIDHERDFDMSYAQVNQLRKKYGIQNAVDDIEYETPQFVAMRMAMHLSANYPAETRLNRVFSYYNSFSLSRVNAPSPNYLNLGTPLKGYASCCLYTVADDTESLFVGNYIAGKMTAMSAGIGGVIQSRSINDKVRGGKIKHLGKLPFYNGVAGNVKMMIQAGRGGACTMYFTVFDPEVITIAMAQNPRTPVDKQNRDIHFACLDNRLFARKVALNEEYFLFNAHSAPDLQEALFSGDMDHFEALYAKYEADPKFVKHYVKAREVQSIIWQQRNEVGTLYRASIDEMNRHTPHYDAVHSSNLCLEITQPTSPYMEMMDLLLGGARGHVEFEDTHGYQHRLAAPDKVVLVKPRKVLDRLRIQMAAQDLQAGDEIYPTGVHVQGSTIVVKKITSLKKEPEISMCSLGGIVITNIHSDEQYEEECYNALEMIWQCIHLSDYPFKHLEYTTKARMNAGVGLLGVAYHMARLGLKYDTREGLAELHRVAERHAYFLIKAALRIGKERGNAPWMHRTKWPEGWLPIDTYKRTVDELTPPVYQYDWEALRAEIIANGGIAFSSLIAHMPTESSSKASGAPNSVYPVRDLSLNKTDVTNKLSWVAPDNDILEEAYQLAWEISPVAQAHFYAVIQKFTDQAISADTYRDRTKTIINAEGKEVIAPLDFKEGREEYLANVKYGNKSQYYNNSYTGGKSMEEIVLKQEEAAGDQAVAIIANLLTHSDGAHVSTDNDVYGTVISSTPGSPSDLARGAAMGLSALDRIAAQAREQIASEGATMALPGVQIEDTDGDNERGCASGACTL